MKRFHLFGFVFALVCGCHIIGVQSYGWSWRYLDPNGICPPFNDQSPVVKIIPGLKTCGGRYTSLRVGKYKSIKGDSLEKCKMYCQSDTKCAYAEFDKNKETCSFAGKESFGANVAEGIVTGYDECPPIGKCPYVGTDYGGYGHGRTSGVNSPRDCQTYCRKTYGSNATINYGFANRYCYCKYAFNFGLNSYRKWISGPLRCHPCFGYKTDLSNLANVHNGSLIKPTVDACQKSCKDNPLCEWFEFKPWTGECRHKNPLTARMNKYNAAFASLDCDRMPGPPFDDQSPVVKIIPGPKTCGARGTSLMVGKYKSIIGDSLKTCQKFCQSDEKCAFAVFDKKKGLCSFAGKESFGANVTEHIVTGPGKCPPIGKCPYVGTDYSGYGHGRTFNIYSPEDCQRYCIRTYGNKAAINYGLSAKVCYCKYAFNFGLNSYSKWISGPLRCPPCLKFEYDLSNLENVYNGSPNPFLIKPTVKACQKSCEDNPRCLWFEYKPRKRECRHKNPLTARMNEKNADFASRDCNRILGPPYDDQSPVVKNIPGLKTCGARGTSLRVRKYKSINGDSLNKCQKLCQSDTKCAYAEFDKNNETCSFAGKESFGAYVAEGIVTGYGKCPPIGKCPYVGIDYPGYEGRLGKKWGINSTKECMTYCRKTYGSNSSINYGFKHNLCYCKEVFNFGLGYYRDWISGPIRCPNCFGYKYDLSNLANVHNGSLIKPTVEACQKSCEDNPLCEWFEFKPRTGECRHKNPLTARMNECNAAFASRDCKGIAACGYCNPNGGYCGVFGNCVCSKWAYTGRECSTCNPEYFKVGNTCKYCNCDQYGSKGRICNAKSGQCPCGPINKGLDCSQCISSHVKSNGRCCTRKSFFNLKAGSCENCECNPVGSSSLLCHSNKVGNCTCKPGYKGERCYDTKVTTITADDKDFYMDGKYFRIIYIGCMGFEDCQVTSINSTGSSQNLYLRASKTLKRHRTKPILYYDDFCTGSNDNGNVVCNAKGKMYSGVPARRFFIHLFSTSSLGSIKLKVKILNLGEATARSKASLPIETNP